MTSGYVDTSQGPIYYEVTGEGPAVVLGHAGIADLRMWDDQVGPYSKRYTVVRYDVRGFGKSPFADQPWAPHDDIAALLDHLGIEKASLVSVSMSGAIAVDFAVAHAQRLNALVVVGSALDGFDFWAADPGMKAEDEKEGQFLEAGDIDGAVDLMVRMWIDGPNREPADVNASVRERVAQMQRAIYESGNNPTEHATELEPLAITHLEDISAPTLVIVGDEDFLAMQTIADVLASRIPGAEKVVIRDTAHVPAWSGLTSSTGSCSTSSRSTPDYCASPDSRNRVMSRAALRPDVSAASV
ncbi:MAG TPA: alpha/beta fold hydrolase [Dehalococcoidia bacterium]|nr:alpha/beta fold hydrolase [Dehalococcoidia bacterium]